MSAKITVRLSEELAVWLEEAAAQSGVHWLDLDEDISVENIILGKPSGESPRSLKKWLESRSA